MFTLRGKRTRQAIESEIEINVDKRNFGTKAQREDPDNSITSFSLQSA